jgi:hypothetical protein
MPSPPAAWSAMHRQVSESAVGETGRHQDAFLQALPFKHVTIETFFEPWFARRRARHPLLNTLTKLLG